MRRRCSHRIARYLARLRPNCTPGERKAFAQLAWTRDVLTAYFAYCPHDHRCIIRACIAAISPDNPKIKEYFND